MKGQAEGAKTVSPARNSQSKSQSRQEKSKLDRLNATHKCADSHCFVSAVQLAMAPKIMEFIRSKDGMGKAPAPEAYDLLIRAYMAAEDVDGMLGALALLSR